jgi:hypothetical protein
LRYSALSDGEYCRHSKLRGKTRGKTNETRFARLINAVANGNLVDYSVLGLFLPRP